MGIALGLGIVFGVRAVESSITGVLPVILLLIATAIVTGTNGRMLCLAAAVGCAIGALAALREGTVEPPLLLSQPASPIVGVIHSDVGSTELGGSAELSWVDDGGVARESTVYLPPAPIVHRGDRVQIIGTVDGDTGQRIFANSVRVEQRAKWVESKRQAIREYIASAIQRHVPGTPGALALGLLIGDDSALTKAETDDLRAAGLSHLTAVSGWNVTLVTSAVGLICLRLGLRGWLWTTLQLLALAGFVWVVGLEPPVTRAAIMAVVGLAAIRLGRPAHSVTALTLSAAVMVAFSPGTLSSLSFQLSVVATLGLVLAARLTHSVDGWGTVVLVPLISTATIGIMTAPMLAAETGSLSLLTVPANILAAPLVPIATIAGLIVVVSSAVIPVAAVAGWVAALLCGSLLWLARTLSEVPYGYHQFAPLSDAAQASMYSAMLVTIALIFPEGRLMVRAISMWVRRDPAAAALSASTACLALLTATLLV